MGVSDPRTTTAPTAALPGLLRGSEIMRVVGANDCLSSTLAARCGFDAIWATGLGISAARGMPDAGILTMSELLDAAGWMVRNTPLPVIADCDTGFGDVNVVRHTVRCFERAGIAAVCIEDKQFPKRNSYRDRHELGEIGEFGAKVRAAKDAQETESFTVIARLESLIAGAGLDDALRRGLCFQDCGADAILIHSKAEDAGEVLAFAERWAAEGSPRPLICIPTSYPSVTADELHDAGFAAVIYANQALRAAVRAIEEVLSSIHHHGSSAQVESRLMSVEELLVLTGMAKVERLDAHYDAYAEEVRGRAGAGAALSDAGLAALVGEPQKPSS